MLGFKIISNSKFKEMDYTTSLHDQEVKNLETQKVGLITKINSLENSNLRLIEICNELKLEIMRLTPERDAFGRYTRRKIKNNNN